MGLIDTIRSQQAKAKDRAAVTPPTGMGFGVMFSKGTIHYKRTKGPLFGAQAQVNSGGEVEHRLIRKDIDRRQLFLTVEGDGFGFVVEIDPDKRAKAEQFAMKINTAARWEPPAQNNDGGRPLVPDQ